MISIAPHVPCNFDTTPQKKTRSTLPLRSITWNIRYATSSPGTNEKPWWSILCPIWADQCRMPHVQSLLSTTAASTTNPTIIGLQEVLSNQLSDVKSGLGSSWAHLGVGRDDGKSSGEFNPLLYRTDTFRVLYSETKWLSPTPDIVSFGWGAGSRRVVTIGVFEHIATGKRFLAANTHLDNVSATARSEGIKVVVSRIEAVHSLYGNSLAVILTGDFNSEPGGDAYATLKNLAYLTEVWETGAKRLGSNQLTFTGFTNTGVSRIDYCWVGPVGEGRVTVQQFEILGNVVGGIIASDHRALVTDMTIL
ncbi:endonuclease/Exonuclease/phosphatase [Rhexocercosporidium sp. MPI-PUGE-AT-0058]|nr:endonuclease/Exonuclease/phosphatase [Rhexocercosporidium sp. MPI-PUGE-AT-0058]